MERQEVRLGLPSKGSWTDEVGIIHDSPIDLAINEASKGEKAAEEKTEKSSKLKGRKRKAVEKEQTDEEVVEVESSKPKGERERLRRRLWRRQGVGLRGQMKRCLTTAMMND